jgi:hypothetical protein
VNNNEFALITWWQALGATERATYCIRFGGQIGHAIANTPPPYIVQAAEVGKIDEWRGSNAARQ